MGSGLMAQSRGIQDYEMRSISQTYNQATPVAPAERPFLAGLDLRRRSVRVWT